MDTRPQNFPPTTNLSDILLTYQAEFRGYVIPRVLNISCPEEGRYTVIDILSFVGASLTLLERRGIQFNNSEIISLFLNFIYNKQNLVSFNIPNILDFVANVLDEISEKIILISYSKKSDKSNNSYSINEVKQKQSDFLMDTLQSEIDCWIEYSYNLRRTYDDDISRTRVRPIFGKVLSRINQLIQKGVIITDFKIQEYEEFMESNIDWSIAPEKEYINYLQKIVRHILLKILIKNNTPSEL